MSPAEPWNPSGGEPWGPPRADERGEHHCPLCGSRLPPAADSPHPDGMGDVRSWFCEECEWEWEG